jgi:hypothetical protein
MVEMSAVLSPVVLSSSLRAAMIVPGMLRARLAPVGP